MAVRWSPFRWISPAGRGARLQVFIFHRVLPHADPLLPDEPDAARFDLLCRWIGRYYRVLPLGEAVARLGRGDLPAAAACITFDDGYRDNLTVAAPILRRHGLPATVFVATGYTGGGRMWNDSVIESVRALPAGEWDGREFGLGVYALGDAASRVRAYGDVLNRLKHLPYDTRQAHADAIAARAGLPAGGSPMMDRSELRALRDAGIDIGAHTRLHPILATLSDSQAEAEIAGSRDELSSWLGETPTLFAYPNGVPQRDYSSRDVALVRRLGFGAAVSTAWGCSGANDDVFQLRRFTPWDTRQFKFAARCMLNRFRAPVLA